MTGTSDKSVKSRTLLACQWRDVVALNFDIDDRTLQPHVPAGTRLAKYNNHSMVTLMAKNARELQAWGKPLTLFRSIRSLDLRCYVECDTAAGALRGHVMLRHIVSSRLCARLLKVLYKSACDVEKITHTVQNFETAQRNALPSAEYQWTSNGEMNHFSVRARKAGRKPAADSREEFVLHQQYRFASKPEGTVVYAIRQTPWVVWSASSGSYECDKSRFLGADFGRHLKKPATIMMSSGGDVRIYRPRPISEFQGQASS